MCVCVCIYIYKSTREPIPSYHGFFKDQNWDYLYLNLWVRCKISGGLKKSEVISFFNDIINDDKTKMGMCIWDLKLYLNLLLHAPS